jgi:hypothetical protein
LIGFCCCIVLAAIGPVSRAPASAFVELAFVGAVLRAPALLFVHVTAISTLAPTSETLDKISRLLILDILMDLAPSTRGNHSAGPCSPTAKDKIDADMKASTYHFYILLVRDPFLRERNSADHITSASSRPWL